MRQPSALAVVGRTVHPLLTCLAKPRRECPARTPTPVRQKFSRAGDPKPGVGRDLPPAAHGAPGHLLHAGARGAQRGVRTGVEDQPPPSKHTQAWTCMQDLRGTRVGHGTCRKGAQRKTNRGLRREGRKKTSKTEKERNQDQGNQTTEREPCIFAS